VRRKPFIVGCDWLVYAHGPAAEDRQPTAVTLCNYASSRNHVVHLFDQGLVREVVSVAELYVGSRGEDEEGKARARKATKIVARGRKWLADQLGPEDFAGNQRDRAGMKTLHESFLADITDLIDRHGCSHFLDGNLEPVEQLKAAIQQLERVSDGPQEKACLSDLRRLLQKYEQA
jgi:hypothetical protein